MIDAGLGGGIRLAIAVLNGVTSPTVGADVLAMIVSPAVMSPINVPAE